MRVLPCIPSDIQSVLDEGLREQDVAEVTAAGHSGPWTALVKSVGASEGLAFTIWVDGKPAGIFGAAPHPEDRSVGIPWMLGTDRLLRAKRELVRDSRPWIDFLNSVYPTLVNIVHVENTVSMRWLRAMGFTLDEIVMVGDHTFRRFHRV